jgi:hypothetical protein
MIQLLRETNFRKEAIEKNSCVAYFLTLPMLNFTDLYAAKRKYSIGSVKK